MRLLAVSATTITLLEGITATPVGVQKLAAAPVPSANAVLPLPASVVTTPRGVTRRMRQLYVSATTTTPLDGITATPYGLLKLAAAPVPSANAWLPLPASVVTTPRGVTCRMRLLRMSATTTMPLEGIMTTPNGSLKLAAAPVPSTNAALPLPARVVTTPLLAAGATPTPDTTSAAACADAAPCASPAAPHSSTPAHGPGSAPHLIHVLALQAMLPPLGSAAGALAPATSKCAPLASTSAPFMAPNTPAAYVGDAPVAARAATPSACEPER